ncbi:MAG: glycosyltransferase family 2 protein [Candidatus Riflebacteria bacterium]
MNSDSARVTVGLPVFNSEKYIGEAIESALNQSFKDFSLIISDNASTDKTPEICRAYAQKDKRITLLRHHENVGPIANFNGLKKSCKTEFFIWLAADDRWETDFLANAVKEMDQKSACALVLCNYLVKNLETGEAESINIRPADFESPTQRVYERIVDMRPSLVYGLQRMSLLGDFFIGRFDFSDVFFTIQAATRGKIAILSQRLYIAGTKGVRKPYSLTGKKIVRLTFLKRAKRFISANFSNTDSVCLILVLSLMLIRNKVVFSIRDLIAWLRLSFNQSGEMNA